MTEHFFSGSDKSDMPITPVNQGRSQAQNITSQAKAWAEGFEFHDADAIQPLSSQDVLKAPKKVQDAVAFYQTWEDRDLGSVRLLKVPMGSKDVFAVSTTTDGDDFFLELYDDKGKLLASGITRPGLEIAWDATVLAVRNEVISASDSPPIAVFFEQLALAQAATTPGGAKVTRAELLGAVTQSLVKPGQPKDTLDGEEASALLKGLSDLQGSAQAWARELVEFFQPPSEVKWSPGGTPTKTIPNVLPAVNELVSAKVTSKGFPPKFLTFQRLAEAGWQLRPSHVLLSTGTGAEAELRSAGVTSSQAKALLKQLQPFQTLYTGRLYREEGPLGLAKDMGPVVFSVDTKTREVRALHLKMPSTDTARESVVNALKSTLGLSDVVAENVELMGISGPNIDIRFGLPTGGEVTARVSIDAAGNLEASNLVLPVLPLPNSVEANLSERLGGGKTVLAYANTDNQWLVAHQEGRAVKLSKIEIQLGGATGPITSVRPPLSDEEAPFLALGLARHHGRAMVTGDDFTDTQRLEVALKTHFRNATEMVETREAFVPQTDSKQWMLPNVWGDNAIIVTFKKDGSVRLEDRN